MRTVAVLLLLASTARAEVLLAERLLEISDRADVEVAAELAAEIGANALARKLLPEAERRPCINCQSMMAARAAYGWAELGEVAELERLRARVEALWKEHNSDESHCCLDRMFLGAAFERAGKTADGDALIAACKTETGWHRMRAAIARGDVARVRALAADRDLGADDRSSVVKLLLGAGEPDAARAIVDRAEQRMSQKADVEVLVAIGEQRVLLGDKDGALVIARRAADLHQFSIMWIALSARLADLLAAAGDQAAGDALWSRISSTPMSPAALAKVLAEHGRANEARSLIALAEKQLGSLEKKTQTAAAQETRARGMEQRKMDPLIPHAVYEGSHEMLALACAASGDFLGALRHLLKVTAVPVSRMGHHPLFEVARRAHAQKIRITREMQPLLARLKTHIAARE